MIHGTYTVPRVVEESYCRPSLDYNFSELGDYKIHSTSLCPNIPFDYAEELPYEIDESIFLNYDETELEFDDDTYIQNYLTTRYIGRAPLEFYTDIGNPRIANPTRKDRQFILICRGGDPSYSFRVFGTEDAIRGYNRNANESVLYPIPEGVRIDDVVST